MHADAIELIDKVVKNDYCVGCGVCASIDGSPFTMKLDENGKYVPMIDDNKLSNEKDVDLMSVCPFSDRIKNETQIGKEIFDEYGATYNKYTGFYLKNYAGYVKEGDYRNRGSSGGMGNWIAAQLLKLDLVDGIIHVKPTPDSKDNSALFEYGISNDLNELMIGSKSKYYPIEMSKVIDFVKENKGRYALIGIPCFIKSVRLLAQKNEKIKERIKFYIGLVCGHLKSDMFAKSMGWQMGVEPDNLIKIDFRDKLEGRPSNDYGVKVEGTIDGETKTLRAARRELYTTNWGQGLFKYNACEFCDDVLSETADVTVGDAWLPEYKSDSMGTNIIIVRHPVIKDILENAGGKISIKELSPDKIYQSQAGGFRHRRDGLAYRLYLIDEQNKWRPAKRVKPDNSLPTKRKKVYEKRMRLSKESFKAYKLARKVNDFNAFIDYMDPLVQEYNKVIKRSFTRRVLSKIKHGMYRLIKK